MNSPGPAGKRGSIWDQLDVADDGADRYDHHASHLHGHSGFEGLELLGELGIDGIDLGVEPVDVGLRRDFAFEGFGKRGGKGSCLFFGEAPRGEALCKS